MEYRTVPLEVFQGALRAARDAWPLVARYTCGPEDINELSVCYLAPDAKSGFVISEGEYLTGVFSLVRGRGDDLVKAAIALGADCLDCWGDYLLNLYGRHGFVESGRDHDLIAMYIPNPKIGAPSTMQITTTFEVDPRGSDPDKVRAAFGAYLSEALELPQAEDEEPFSVTSVHVVQETSEEEPVGRPDGPGLMVPTRVVPSEQAGYLPGKWQAQYQPDGDAWYDIGDPTASKAAAEAKADEHNRVDPLSVDCPTCLMPAGGRCEPHAEVGTHRTRVIAAQEHR